MIQFKNALDIANKNFYESFYDIYTDPFKNYDYLLRWNNLWQAMNSLNLTRRALRVLDLGCGYSYLPTVFDSKSTVIGLDASPSSVMASRTHYKNWFVATAYQVWDLNIGLPEVGTVDIVIASHIFEHVWEWRRLCKAIERCCRPGSILVVISPLFGQQTQLHRLDYTHKECDFSGYKEIYNKQFGTTKILCRWARKKGVPLHTLTAAAMHRFMCAFPFLSAVLLERVLQQAGIKPTELLTVLRKL